MSSVFVFTGDSITAADRLWQSGGDGLGCGYVSLLAPRLKAAFGDAAFCNKGFDGFTVPALLRLIRQDNFFEKADFITILAGINDAGIAMNTGVSFKEQRFEENYRQLLTEIAGRSDARILCACPFVFPYPQEYTNWIPTVLEAETKIMQIAEEMGISCIPLQKPLNDAAEERGYHTITTDGIHLTREGHRLLASVLYPFYFRGQPCRAS